MVIISSSSWLQFQLTQAWEYTTIIQHFMVTNHPIMSGHFSPHQMPLSKGQNYQLNGQFAAPSLLAIPAHSCPLSPYLGL
jgi:hypothetical protein